MEEELQRIADRIRRWRVDAGLTLQEVASSAGVSASTVHKIENLQTVPTVSVLLKVAHGLRRRPHELFDGGTLPTRVALTRLSERNALQTRPGALLEHVVGGIDDASIDLWRVTHTPGCGSRAEPDSPPLRYRGELIIVADVGSLHVRVGDEEFDLEPGDTLHFDTNTPHSWVNLTDANVSAFFIGLMPKGAGKRA